MTKIDALSLKKFWTHFQKAYLRPFSGLNVYVGQLTFNFNLIQNTPLPLPKRSGSASVCNVWSNVTSFSKSLPLQNPGYASTHIVTVGTEIAAPHKQQLTVAAVQLRFH